MNKEEHTFNSRESFRKWLSENYAQTNGIWILFTKGDKDFTANDALEEALCFGWIDSTVKSIDSKTYKKYFCKRKDKANWSEKNIKTYKNLEKLGKITQSGIDAFKPEKPKQDKNLIDELNIQKLKEVLASDKTAHAQFEQISASRKKQMAAFYCDAKTDETRNKRLARIIDSVINGKKEMLY